MKKGDIVEWAGKKSPYKIGLVISLCPLQNLWYVIFADGEYEIEEKFLKVIFKQT